MQDISSGQSSLAAPNNFKCRFHVTFVFAEQNITQKPSWVWQETNIKMLEDEWQPTKSSVSFATTTPIIPAQLISSHTPSQDDPVVQVTSKEKNISES
jgi:hypothetical protein